MADSATDTIKKIDEALKAGDFSGAAKLAAAGATAGPAPGPAAASSSAAPAAPRDPTVVFDDLIRGIVTHLGNPPHLAALLDELAKIDAAPSKAGEKAA